MFSLFPGSLLFTAFALLLGAWPADARAHDPSPEEADQDEETVLWTHEDCAGVVARVRDAETGEAVAGAGVAILPWTERGEKTGPLDAASLRTPDLRKIGTTDLDGALLIPPPGAARLYVSLPGWDAADIQVPCSSAIEVMEVALRPLPAARMTDASEAGDAHRRRRGDSLETMAGTPRNLFQAVQTLPGVARPTFEGALLGSILGMGDLGVRGSRSGESRTYLDGIEIPYYYHYLGLSSVLPAEMIEEADFVPGGAGPRFGRLTGGVLDIRSKALDSEESTGYGRAPWRGRANLTFFEANAIGRGPVGKGYLSVSDRFSLMDLIYRANEKNWRPGSPVWGYNDMQLVYKRPVGARSELSALAFGTFDEVRLVDRPTILRTEFYRAGLSFRTRGARTRASASASYGYDRFLGRIIEPGQGIRVASHRAKHDVRLASEGEFAVRKGVAIRGGVEAHAFRPSTGISLDWEQQEWVVVDRSYWDRGAWSAVWTEVEARPHPRLVLLPGARFDYDTMVKRGWLDPRMTARWFLDHDTVLSASGGLYHRPQPFSLAFADQRNLGLSEAAQVSGGVERRFGPGLVADARVYQNTFEDQVQGIEWLPDFNEYGNSVLGDGVSRGAEFIVRGVTRDGRTRAEIGYSFSRTEWRNQQTEGEWTASDSDSSHAFSLVASRAMRRGWNAGVRARFYSGLPYTHYQADVYVPDDGSYIGVGRSPFAERAPSFFQLDVRFSKAWRLGPRFGIESFLDIHNLTNRKNVDRLNAAEGRPTSPAARNALPFFPSLGVSLTF